MVVLALTQSLRTVYLFQASVSSSVKWVLGQHLPCYEVSETLGRSLAQRHAITFIIFKILLE